MNPAIKQAFEAWAPSSGRAWEDIGLAKLCFYAGFLAASEQSLMRTRSDTTDDLADAAYALQDCAPDVIYSAYPRKVGKQGAIKAIQKAVRGAGMDKLLKAVKAYAKATESWPEEDRKYIPHPATWFNRGSYEDDPKEWERNTAPTSQFSQSH